MTKIEINKQFRRSIDLIKNTDKSLFITGKAGTGKSTLLEHCRQVIDKKMVVLAPTGVAAVNIKGQTIHSFFKFKPDITVDKVKKKKGKQNNVFKKLDLIFIDEISMVRADLLDCVDKSLRINRNSSKPFGGVQMIFVGDLYQLPPVISSKEKSLFESWYKSPYFFDAKVFETVSVEIIELEKIYRQKDAEFISILNAIRNNSVTAEDIDLLNKRTNKNLSHIKDNDYIISLNITNKDATEINNRELAKLNEKIYRYSANILGDFTKSSYPTDEELSLAVGAQIMLLNNDVYNRWVNGTIAKIIDIKYDEALDCDVIVVELQNGNIENVAPYTWELFNFTFDEKTASIQTETAGTFTQYPLKLAWAITIHKSQGKTFKKVIVDFGRGTFAHGQAYVALSRCISLDGMSLKRPLRKKDVYTDWRIFNFLTEYQYERSERKVPFDKKVEIIDQAIEKNKCLEITYLKSNDQKSNRKIKPFDVGELFFLNKPFFGMQAFCTKRNEERVFRVDRILEIKEVE